MDKESESPAQAEEEDIPVKIKEEPPEDIKNYAESTMNELLSWYGYDDKVNSSDTKNLNLEKYTDKETDENGVAGDDVISDDGSLDSADTETPRRKLRNNLTNGQTSLAEQHRSLVSALSQRAEQDERVEDGDHSDVPLQCAWCGKPGNKTLTLKTPTGTKAFCGEVCFTQCRRASFKKSKICDWCKHIRHTVNYVDFQDGETQLQFCSEKCLNQYKMSIFCKETQEHLQQIQESSEDSSAEKDNDKEILITPDLWLNGVQSRKSSDRRLSLPTGSDKRDVREQLRKSFSASIEKSILRKMSESSQNKDKHLTRQPLLERIKTESSGKHKRNSRRESDRLNNHVATEAPSTSPKQSAPAPAHLSPQLLHPGMAAGMTPWLQHAHLMNAFAPGMTPLPAFPGMMFPGMLSPYGATVLPDGSSTAGTDRATSRQSTSRSALPLAGGQMLSPNSERSSTSEPSADGQRTETPTITRATTQSPATAGTSAGSRRTSSLFPVDFPQMFPPQGLPPGMFPPPFPGGVPAIPGMPPATMMMPFPVVLPMPVPIPIPIPATLDQLMKHFQSAKSDSTRTETVSDANHSPSDKIDSRSPRPGTICSPASVTSTGSDIRLLDKLVLGEPRSGSRNSCPDLSLSYSSDSYLTVPDSHSYKRSRTPDEQMSLDLSKRAKHDYDSLQSQSTDGVIDLSAKDSTRRSTSISHSGELSDTEEKTRDSNGNITTETGLPKIHIITHRNDIPLNRPLPLPPTENPYSTRRGLILDAPAIPKKPRSPSPERRSYVRNVPRDIMEAARRRCLRTRIRTK